MKDLESRILELVNLSRELSVEEHGPTFDEFKVALNAGEIILR